LIFEEPYDRFYAHGMIIKDGAKMSKSRGNIVIPDEYIKKFGADAFRAYLMFLGPYDAGGDFRDTGIEGMRRFIERVWDLFENTVDLSVVNKKDSDEVLTKMHQTIKKVTNDIENLRYNTAISAVMEYVNLLREKASQADDKTKDEVVKPAAKASEIKKGWSVNEAGILVRDGELVKCPFEGFKNCNNKCPHYEDIKLSPPKLRVVGAMLTCGTGKKN